MLEAQQGEGKTVTGTAIAVDAYFANIYAIKSPRGKTYKVSPYYLDTVYLHEKDKKGNETKRIIKIPDGWETFSGVKIFANYHLYGIKYVYCDAATMLKYLNSNMISNGILLVDEAYITGDARQGMNALAKLFTWFGQQMRKRKVELYIIVQHGRFIDWRFRYIMTRKIECKYNEDTHVVTLLIKDLKKGTQKEVPYLSSVYWRFYDTNELPEVPKGMIASAAKWVM